MLEIYLVRHGKTMFNTIGRSQGWSDSPLTKKGEEGISKLGRGLKKEGIHFDRAYSSDSGRTIQTTNLILKNSDNEGIPYQTDPRIREWCFGSFDGDYSAVLFGDLLPRILDEVSDEKSSTKDLANAIYDVDTAGWAETWEELSTRILEGFHDIAKEAQELSAKKIVVVSHGMTISTFLELLDPEGPHPYNLDNGSVTKFSYEDGKFTVEKVGDMSYQELDRKTLEK